MEMMNTRFLSLDIETLGLGVDAPIIEFGAVVGDWTTKTIIGSYHTYVTHAHYNNCEPFAMSMHPVILRRIAKKAMGYNYTPIDMLAYDVRSWFLDVAAENGPIFAKNKFLVAGKNAAGFDLPMLRKQCPAWDDLVPCSHRVLDPGPMLWDPITDELPPNLKECMERTNINREVSHTALEDAIDVAEVIFHIAESRS